MAGKTEIAWCDSTFNPWIGCTKVGQGCDNCYAEADFDLRRHRAKWGAGQERSRTSAANWKQPLRWNSQPFGECRECGWRGFYGTSSALRCGRCGSPAATARRRVFCASLADVFDNEVPRQWRIDLFRLILDTPNLDWLLLTKRIGNAARMLQDTAECIGPMMDANDRYRPLPNVWIGATVVNQAEADRDIPKLLATPAAVRFLSIEPMLGPIDLDRWINPVSQTLGTLHQAPFALSWVVAGGESGPKARPMHPDWARLLRDQCAAADVPFLFKQWGEWVSADCLDFDAQNKIWRDRSHLEMRDADLIRLFPEPKPPGPPHFGCNHWLRAGKKAAGRLLDGVLHNEFPGEA